MSTAPTTSAEGCHLRPATMDDRRRIWCALACSELTETLLGRPGSPEAPAQSWEDFCADHEDHYFDDSDPRSGRAFVIVADGVDVGVLYWNVIFGEPPRTELDIWMFGEAECDRGRGPVALRMLCDHLRRTYGVRECFMMPAGTNARAIRAYEKAGFEPSPYDAEDNARRYRAPDGPETMYLRRVLA